MIDFFLLHTANTRILFRLLLSFLLHPPFFRTDQNINVHSISSLNSCSGQLKTAAAAAYNLSATICGSFNHITAAAGTEKKCSPAATNNQAFPGRCRRILAAAMETETARKRKKIHRSLVLHQFVVESLLSFSL